MSATATRTPCWRSTPRTRSDGAVVDIAANAKLDKPLLLVSAARRATMPQLLATRNVVSVGDGAEATIIEAFVATAQGGQADAQLNAATEIDVGNGREPSRT